MTGMGGVNGTRSGDKVNSKQRKIGERGLMLLGGRLGIPGLGKKAKFVEESKEKVTFNSLEAIIIKLHLPLKTSTPSLPPSPSLSHDKAPSPLQTLNSLPPSLSLPLPPSLYLSLCLYLFEISCEEQPRTTLDGSFSDVGETAPSRRRNLLQGADVCCQFSWKHHSHSGP